MIFGDRAHAGRLLAEALAGRPRRDPIVLALPRGGVQVGAELARELPAPLDVVVARKIGAPFEPEFGVGAVTPEGPPVFDQATLAALRLGPDDLRESVERERAEARRRLRAYRAGRPEPALADRTVLVVDDGLATGVTARAALLAARAAGAGELVFAAPVCAPDAAETLRREYADDVVCLHLPPDFGSVGSWYGRFDQLDDGDVLDLLAAAREG